MPLADEIVSMHNFFLFFLFFSLLFLPRLHCIFHLTLVGCVHLSCDMVDYLDTKVMKAPKVFRSVLS